MEVTIIGETRDYRNLFIDKGHSIIPMNRLYDTDLVVFTGGEDVTPAWYGEEPGPKTFYNPIRDKKERDIFVNCEMMSIPMVGICRGGQFLNVMNGGKMLQHVQGHTKSHMMQDIYDQWALVSSTHHQMMIRHPSGLQVAWAMEGCSKQAFVGNQYIEVEEDIDTEVVYYASTNSLCFQPHPEFTGAEYADMKSMFFMYLKSFMEFE